MKVSEFKKLVENIPIEYDDLELYVTDPDYNEYCLGPDVTSVDDVEFWKHELKGNGPILHMEVHL